MLNAIRRAAQAVIPTPLRHGIRGLWGTFRSATGNLRMMPDFIIIGAQRSGTTTLFNHLTEHPEIADGWRKDTQFFTYHFDKGLRWYRGNYPLRITRRVVTTLRQRPYLTGEGTGYYLFHPGVPQRVFDALPQVKLIAMLRNPVTRAISHYHHEVRLGNEDLPIDQAMDAEPERLKKELEKVNADPAYYSHHHHHHTYLMRGLYLDHIKAWRAYYPAEQMFIFRSEELFAEPERVFPKILTFLGVSPSWAPREFRQYNIGGYAQTDEALVRRLHAYFEPHNRRLYDYLGVQWDWDD